MLSQKVKQYIQDHSLYSEYIFRDWEAFLDLLYAEGGRVSAILWWDHCRIADQHESIGMGGFIDPENPEYMFAETMVFDKGFETKSLEEIKEYIADIRDRDLCLGTYIAFDLVPSFYLCK